MLASGMHHQYSLNPDQRLTVRGHSGWLVADRGVSSRPDRDQPASGPMFPISGDSPKLPFETRNARPSAVRRICTQLFLKLSVVLFKVRW
jgi:hypothetical protein